MKVVANIAREDGDGLTTEPSRFVLNVKEGRQTFKWLAQVLQARLGVSASSPCLVKAITNSDSVLLDPRDCIAEHAVQWSIRYCCERCSGIYLIGTISESQRVTIRT